MRQTEAGAQYSKRLQKRNANPTSVEPFEFEWPVYDKGYHLLDGGTHLAGLQIVEDKGRPLRVSRPLTEATGLFREFAALSENPEAYLNFAQRYGRLGIPPKPGADALLRIPDASSSDRDQLGEPEGVVRWRMEHQAMRWGVRLWGALTREDEARITSALAEPPADAAALYMLLPPGAPPAQRGMISLALLASQRTHHWSGVGLQWRPNRSHPSRGSVRVRIVPTNLLGAMWLQFALSMEGEGQHRQCGRCTRWFEVSPETARTNRRFCSPACKQKDYRQRRQLRRAGADTA